jgi:hypothetical protein
MENDNQIRHELVHACRPWCLSAIMRHTSAVLILTFAGGDAPWLK